MGIYRIAVKYKGKQVDVIEIEADDVEGAVDEGFQEAVDCIELGTPEEVSEEKGFEEMESEEEEEVE